MVVLVLASIREILFKCPIGIPSDIGPLRLEQLVGQAFHDVRGQPNRHVQLILELLRKLTGLQSAADGVDQHGLMSVP